MTKTATLVPVRTSAKGAVPPAQVSTKTPVSKGAAAETKTPRPTTATREACKEVRKDLDPRAHIKPTGKNIAARAGSLRYNILKAIMTSKTFVEACTKEVNGPGKHADIPYRVKMVDCGFALANGYVTVVAK